MGIDIGMFFEDRRKLAGGSGTVASWRTEFGEPIKHCYGGRIVGTIIDDDDAIGTNRLGKRRFDCFTDERS